MHFLAQTIFHPRIFGTLFGALAHLHNSLLVQLALVESELLALQDVAIATAGLTGPASDDGEKTTGLELLLESGVDLATLGEPGGLLLLDRLALLDLLDGCALLLLTAATERLAVVCLVPLTEGGGIDLYDGGLG